MSVQLSELGQSHINTETDTLVGGDMFCEIALNFMRFDATRMAAAGCGGRVLANNRPVLRMNI